VLDAYQEAIAWVMAQAQLTDAAKGEFADTDNADAWVIALPPVVPVAIVIRVASVTAVAVVPVAFVVT